MRQFLYKISYTVCPLLFAFFILGGLYKYYISPGETGDLGRVGKICFGHEYTQEHENHYLKENLVDDFKGDEDKKYNIITFGDSFSQRGIYGYQNYLAHIQKERILNIKIQEDMAPEQMALAFLNSGLLTKLSPKIVIIETVERQFISRLLALNFDIRLTVSDIQEHYRKEEKQLPNLVKNNLYETLNWIRLRTGFKSPVKELQLKDDLFSICGDELYFFRDDLKRNDINEKEKEIVCASMDTLKQKFSANNIRVIYMVAADKYDVYEPFIVENPYLPNKTLDHFNDLDTMGFFINTKSLLQPFVKKGVKDIYLANDTHWSYTAYKLVAEKIASVIKN